MDAIEEKIIKNIEDHREEVLAFARDIFEHAELGYKEFATAEKFAKLTEKLGLRTRHRLPV